MQGRGFSVLRESYNRSILETLAFPRLICNLVLFCAAVAIVSPAQSVVFHTLAVFKITPEGILSTLYRFNGTDGNSPVAGLVQGSDGNFYGGTDVGGAYNLGTIFKINSVGALTTLYSFQGYPTEGAGPETAMVQASNGFFYGTTAGGGAYVDGTVFSLLVIRTCAICGY